MKFHDPQRITFRLPGDTHETTFWYMLYEVTNSTGRDVEFFPSFRLVTDTLQVVTAGDDISPSVYDAIAARHKREFPFFAPPTKVTGLLLQGRENARASAAVFRMFDKEASAFTVYGAGFSGDMDRVPNPSFDTTKEESEKNQRLVLDEKIELARTNLLDARTNHKKAERLYKDMLKSPGDDCDPAVEYTHASASHASFRRSAIRTDPALLYSSRHLGDPIRCRESRP